jgi:serine O-acetyltransferase
MFICHNSRVPATVIIGKRTKFTARGMGIIMNGEEVIGENCQIGHHVKMLRKNPYKKCAQIGNNVYISSGAVIVGNVIIENDVIIGANAVVTKSVPSGCIVGGIPAKIIGYTKDLDYNLFQNPKDRDGIAPYLDKQT